MVSSLLFPDKRIDILWYRGKQFRAAPPPSASQINFGRCLPALLRASGRWWSNSISFFSGAKKELWPYCIYGRQGCPWVIILPSVRNEGTMMEIKQLARQRGGGNKKRHSCFPYTHLGIKIWKEKEEGYSSERDLCSRAWVQKTLTIKKWKEGQSRVGADGI